MVAGRGQLSHGINDAVPDAVIVALVREWCGQKKIFFVHLRDIEGTRTHFHETFPDDDPTDMAQMLRVYHDFGFEGPFRPEPRTDSGGGIQ